MSRAKDDPGSTYGEVSGFHGSHENGFVGSVNSLGNDLLPKEESVPFSTLSEPSRNLDPRLEVSKRSMGSISALKELVSFLINSNQFWPIYLYYTRIKFRIDML